MKRPYGTLLALLVLIGPAVAGGAAAAAPGESRPGDVAVLVIDDFGLGKDPQAEPGDRDENCTVGTNDVGSNGAGDDLPVSTYGHGELVYRVLADELTAVLGQPPVGSTTMPRPVPGPPIETTTEWKFPIGGAHHAARLVAVHTDRYRTDDLLDGIRDRITALRRDGFQRFVLNLSFVVIPCDVVGWLNDADLDALLRTYDAMIQKDPALKAGLLGYLDAAGKLDPGLVRSGGFTATLLRDDGLGPMRPYLAGAFYQTIDIQEFSVEQRPLSTIYDDPGWRGFRKQFVEPGASGATLKVIPVGAAGNGVKYPDPKADPDTAHDPANLIRRGLPFPFAPALWDFVVSASADGDKDVTARLNSGEVKLDGTGPGLVPGSFGTSFAAPRLSTLEAKYLAETGTVACGGTPPLGYVDLSGSPVLNLAVDSPWKNRERADWPSICATFPT
ncbi:hypothetical protein EV385_1124 [Krasilnikovia cinnamomea]|uniref:Uncharacterized protein n=1 Tax=Krasilnikovia cinnamomea TaxID=349313 RepID=A0A4Q7ZG75_9ACTN|nr:hypothetical protein [Krasilnikovia cinnamomea]RZU49374.1 hypothetical protein EV385_1124 [Krasilnikovia cinnamomea]